MNLEKYTRLVANSVSRNIGEAWSPTKGDSQLIAFNFNNDVSSAATAEDICRVLQGGREEWEMKIRLALIRQPTRRRQRLVKQIAALIQTACIVLLLAGCVTQQEIATADYGPEPTEYQAGITAKLKAALRDPYTAHLEFEAPEQWVRHDWNSITNKRYAGWMVRVRVNAKNAFGGYTGYQTYGFLINRGEIIRCIEPGEWSNYH